MGIDETRDGKGEKKADLSGYEIDQMISTDPNDYLNQQLMPDPISICNFSTTFNTSRV